ncbi:hypothetical protein LCGC14_2815720 [marine sediment metagenome]|uniref:Holin n=1 Tax=marine sediment metagenome TaxID=412755 RepID=A0A0F8YII4_9ZZZZ
METKKWYKSLGEWAAIGIPFVALVLPILSQAELGKFITAESAGLSEWLTALGVLIGSALAFYGRWRARTKITA